MHEFKKGKQSVTLLYGSCTRDKQRQRERKKLPEIAFYVIIRISQALVTSQPQRDNLRRLLSVAFFTQPWGQLRASPQSWGRYNSCWSRPHPGSPTGGPHSRRTASRRRAGCSATTARNCCCPQTAASPKCRR